MSGAKAGEGEAGGAVADEAAQAGSGTVTRTAEDARRAADRARRAADNNTAGENSTAPSTGNISMTADGVSKNERHMLISFFWGTFGILLLMSGIHMGIVIGMVEAEWNPILEVHLILIYWALVAFGITLYARAQIRGTYQKPMRRLAEASRRVANGDFSVYVEPVHTPDRYDYIDMMIRDFNTMVEELGSVETLKTDFFADVSHEMKTPLASISYNAQLLDEAKLSEEQRRECVAAIRDSSQRMSSLITNMLKFNKLEKQAIKPQAQRYDVCDQVAQCLFQFEDKLESKQLDVEAELDNRVYVAADRELLDLVWTNILSNAVKFTPERGTISITERTVCGQTDGTGTGRTGESGTRRAGMAYVTIADTGCGMDAETMEHIFDKFYQGDTSHATAGNGLGLALVKRILELSDGTIDVKSKPGKGSAFTVGLPLAQETQEAKETVQ